MNIKKTQTVTKTKKGYISSLDGWRAIAILLVLVAHANEQLIDVFDNSNAFHQFESFGLFGVRIFFAISGFLITLRIMEEINKNGHLSFKGFYIRRTFRIIPALFFFSLIIGVLSLLGIIELTVFEWFSGPLFYANFIDKPWYIGHLWSLAVEEHFYLFWPLALVFFKLNKKIGCLILVISIIAFWRAVVLKFGWYSSPQVYWSRTDIHIDGLLWGCFFAFLYIDKNIKLKLNYLFTKIKPSYLVT